MSVNKFSLLSLIRSLQKYKFMFGSHEVHPAAWFSFQQQSGMSERCNNGAARSAGNAHQQWLIIALNKLHLGGF